MKHSEFDVRTATWGEIKKIEKYDMAILPWGSTEPHNGHLPYGTDVLCSQAIAFDVAEKAAANGVKLMVLPAVPYGSQNPGQAELPFCLHTSLATQAAILRDIVASLERQGIDKLLIINGHGGNNFKGMVRDLAVEKPGMTVIASDWFGIIPCRGYFDAVVDEHAGEQETSVIMYYYPELVKMEYAGSGAARKFAVDALNRKVGWLPRNWAKVTDDTGIGDPSASTPEKGGRYVAAVIAEYVSLVTDLCQKGLY